MTTHTCLPQMYYGGSWHVLNPGVDPDAYALTSQQVRITRGWTSAESAPPKPAKIQFRIHDPLDKYRPTNPMSPIYGTAGQNSPISVSSDGSLRAVGQASVFEPDQTEGFTVGPPIRGQRWVDITAEGILRQIGLWVTPLRSPIYRNTMGLTRLLGYWSLEDESKATQLSNAVPGGQPGQAAGVTFQGEDGADGSGKVVGLSVSNASAMSGKFASASSTAGWQVSFSVNLGTVTASVLPMFTWTTTNGYTWSISVDTTTYGLKVVDRSGTTLVSSSVLHGTGAAPGQWMRFRLQASVTAGTVTADWAWYPQGAPVLYGTGSSFSGTVGALASWRVNANANNDGAGYGHVFGVTTILDDLLSGSSVASFNGYVGESAGARFQRLCTEEGISRTVIGSVADTWLMGRQQPDTFLNLLKEIAATEDAMIFDRRDALGLTMRTRTDRYNQTVKLALTYGVDVAVPLKEKISDVEAANLVTASQRDGGDATVTEATGPMSVLPPPDGIGEYKQTVDVNVADEADLPLLAGWWLSKGTVPGGRYEQVTVDLDAPTGPGLLSAVNSVDLGDRITIAGRTPDLLELIVIGIDETIETHRRKVTFNTVPGNSWTPAVYDGARRYGATNSVTVGTMTTTSGTVTAAVPVDRWGTANLPYDIDIAGERMRVTSVFTSGANQGLNVTRSINGVVKTHAAGEPIQVHNEQVARYGL